MFLFIFVRDCLLSKASPLRSLSRQSLTKINKNNQIAKWTFLEELRDIQNCMAGSVAMGILSFETERSVFYIK